jgi:glutamate synthase domain-containing protein 3
MSATIQAVEIDTKGLYYRDLNQNIRQAVEDGAVRIVLRNVTGQRYIGTNLHDAANLDNLKSLGIDIYGTPGNDLGMFLNGPTVTVHGNVMDGTGNTMNKGRIIVHGRAGDITGFSSRGGELFIRDNAGYRVAIHMKEYNEMRPVMVIGGTTQDFLGEYMAGGVVIILGLTLKPGESHYCSHVGTGMHGGKIFLRGDINSHQIGTGVGNVEITQEDSELLSKYIAEYGKLFNIDVSNINVDQFKKFAPLSKRPYKQLYAY